MHPLALEDVLHQRGHARSKADYYQRHLFLRVLCHSLSDEETDPLATSVTHLPRSDSPEPMDEEDEDEKFPDDEKTEFGSASGSKFSTRRGGTLRNHAKRQLGANGDLETRMANSPGRKSPEVDKKVRTKCFHSQRGTLFSGR